MADCMRIVKKVHLKFEIHYEKVMNTTVIIVLLKNNNSFSCTKTLSKVRNCTKALSHKYL